MLNLLQPKIWSVHNYYLLCPKNHVILPRDATNSNMATASVVSSNEEVFDPSLTVPSPGTEGVPSLKVPSPGNEVLCDSTGSYSITVTPGQVFKTVDEIERFIMHLKIDHHPLKVYKSESVESYNKKVQ